jgi:hypothetical protein
VTNESAPIWAIVTEGTKTHKKKKEFRVFILCVLWLNNCPSNRLFKTNKVGLQ